jgi:hypothetical protein
MTTLLREAISIPARVARYLTRAEHGPWRTIGPVPSFTIDENLLAEGTQIFSAAANNLRAAPDPINQITIGSKTIY